MQLIELPAELVFKYVNDNFGDTSGLAEHLQSFPVAQYTACALVPNGTLLNRALEFDRGGLFSMSQTLRWLSERLKELGQQYGGGTFFVQDVWMTIEDRARFLSEFRAAMFGYDVSPYFWLGGENFSYDWVEDTLGATRSFQIVAAFTSHPLHKNQVGNDLMIDGSSFGALLSGVKEYYLRAYDQESYIVLRQRKQI